MTDELHFLQICPYDRAPFRDVCRAHSAAASLLGWRSHTVFLHSPDSSPDHLPAVDHRYYMEGPDDAVGLRHLGQLAPSKLCIFHRYRSLRVARRTRLRCRREVLLAHEFGLLDSGWRKLRLGRSEPSLRLAGVSPPVAAELGTPWVLQNALISTEQDHRRVSRAVARTQLGLDGEELVVGVVGRLHHKKNCELALRGFAEFASTAGLRPSEGVKPRLLFMGDGDQRESLAELAQSLAVKVSFSGFVPDAARYLPALDLLLFPASRAEAFGMVALEAMLAEVPVVCSRAPGPAWVLGEGASYFDNDEPLEVAAALHRGFDTKPTARARALEVFSPRGLAERLEAIAQ